MALQPFVSADPSDAASALQELFVQNGECCTDTGLALALTLAWKRAQWWLLFEARVMETRVISHKKTHTRLWIRNRCRQLQEPTVSFVVTHARQTPVESVELKVSTRFCVYTRIKTTFCDKLRLLKLLLLNSA